MSAEGADDIDAAALLDSRVLGGYSNPALVPTYATFFVVTEAVLIPLIVVYYHRRHLYPLNAREPFFTLAAGVFGCCVLLVDCLDKFLGVDLPCEVVLFSGNLFLHGLMASYAMRPLALLFKFRDTSAKLREMSRNSSVSEGIPTGDPAGGEDSQRRLESPDATSGDQIVSSNASVALEMQVTSKHNEENTADSQHGSSPAAKRSVSKSQKGDGEGSAPNSYGERVSVTPLKDRNAKGVGFADNGHLKKKRPSISHVWVKYRMFWRTTGLHKIWLALLALHLISAVGSIAAVAFTDGCSLFEDMELLIGGFVFLYSMLYIYLGVKIGRCGADGFGFKSELKYLAIDGLVVIVIWLPSAFVSELLSIDQNDFTYTDLVIDTGVFVSFFFTMLQPLLESYRFEKYLRVATSTSGESQVLSSFDDAKADMVSASPKNRGHLENVVVSRTAPHRSVGIREVLASREASRVFRDFLATEFAVENLSFFHGVDNYKLKIAKSLERGDDDGTVDEKVKRKHPYRRARKLARKFIQEGAVLEVNIPFRVREPILSHLGLSRVEKSFASTVDDENFWSDTNTGNTDQNLGVPAKGHARTSTFSRVSDMELSGEERDVSKSELNVKDVERLSTLFDDAQREVFKLLKRDSFPRFARSEFFEDAVACLDPLRST